MLKYMVVVYRRPELNPAQFRRHLEEVPQWDAIVELYFDNRAAMHGPLAKNLPGLRKYTQNYPCVDPKRNAGCVEQSAGRGFRRRPSSIR